MNQVAQYVILSIQIERLEQVVSKLTHEEFNKTGNFLKFMDLSNLLEKFKEVTGKSPEWKEDVPNEQLVEYLRLLVLVDRLEFSEQDVYDLSKLIQNIENLDRKIEKIKYTEFVEQFYFLFDIYIEDKDFFIGFIVQEYAKVWQDWTV